MKIRNASLLALTLSCSLLTHTAIAGFDEGLAAYNKQDYASALRELKPLATQGNASAQNNLGVMYDNGQGVTQNVKEAIKWYRAAADQGYANAQYNLGMTYINDQRVQQDFNEARKWFRLSAERGNARALSDLGIMYANGLSVAQSFVIAYALCNLSVAGDSSKDTHALANRATYAKLMSSQDIEAAEALTRELSQPKDFLKTLDKYTK